MNINELLSRIIENSHDEDTPDTNLKTKALHWLNSAYHELIDECMPFLERYLETSVTVTLTSGTAELPTDVYRIIKVVDEDNNRVLTETNLREVLEKDPTQNIEGKAASFWLAGNYLNVYPKSNANLKVYYSKGASDLEEDDAENALILPKQFHYSLVWGGLVWSSVYERGFSNQTELAMYQRKWDEAKQKIKLSLASKPSAALRVSPYDAA